MVVTDRGAPVAQLTALPGRSAIERGVEEGWIEPARRAALVERPRRPVTRSVMEVLDEDRG